MEWMIFYKTLMMFKRKSIKLCKVISMKKNIMNQKEELINKNMNNQKNKVKKNKEKKRKN